MSLLVPYIYNLHLQLFEFLIVLFFSILNCNCTFCILMLYSKN